MESTFPALNRTERGVGFAAAFPEFAGYIDARIAERDRAARRGRGPRRRARAPDPPRGRRRAAAAAAAARARAQPHHRRAHDDEPAARQPAASRCSPGPTLDAAVRGRSHAARDRDRGEPAPRRRRSCSSPAAACATPRSAAARCTRASASSSAPRPRTATSASSITPTSSASIAPTPTSTSRSATARTCARARPWRARSHASASSAVLDHFAPGELQLEPGFVFEQVPTYFEHGPRRLPVVRVDGCTRSAARRWSSRSWASPKPNTCRRRSRSSSRGRSWSGRCRRSATAGGTRASEP